MNLIQALRTCAAAAVLLAAGSAALAQAAPPASAPTPDQRPGRGSGPRAGSDYTWGWSMMTPQERREHHEKMRSLHTPDECRNYMEQHHQQMVERAKARGRDMPARPRRDACAMMR
jgi:hypothetical protein